MLIQKLRRGLDNLMHNISYLLRRRLGASSDGETSQRNHDTYVLAQQLKDVLKYENIAPPPPKHLQMRVVMGYNADFIESGIHICADLDRVLAPTGKRLQDFNRILDFGCGCGRNSRALKFLCKNSEIVGSDIDGEAIQWLQDNYQSVGTFSQNAHRPPMDFPDNYFDFIFSISVLTHLPEDMQFEWLGELQRIVKPGGYLILTTHGTNHLNDLTNADRAVLEKNGFLYKAFAATDGLPDFYQVAYHTLDYIKEKWQPYFDVLAVVERGIAGRQDAVLLRKVP